MPPFDAPSAAIDALAAALPANGTEQSEAASTWQQATAAMEIVDTIELSLQKGRTIEVHQQRLTEQLAFRGTMAAFGCGLLLVTFFALVVAGIVGRRARCAAQGLLADRAAGGARGISLDASTALAREAPSPDVEPPATDAADR